MEEKKKNKKSKGLIVGTLTITSNRNISIPLTEEVEERKLRETLQRNTVEKRAPPAPYFENVGPLGLELQRMTLKKAVKRKAQMEAARARGEDTSAQGRVPTPRGTLVAASSAIVSRRSNLPHKIN